MNTFNIKNQIWGYSLKSRRQGNTGPVFLDCIKQQQPKHGSGTTFWYAAVFFFFFFKQFSSSLFVCLSIYLWLCWVFVSVRGLSLVAASRGHSSSRCAGLSLSRPLLWRSTGSRRAGSVIVAHGPSCSAACGIFPDQGSNPCPLHWQADSQPLRHQGSPMPLFLSALLNQLWCLTGPTCE